MSQKKHIRLADVVKVYSWEDSHDQSKIVPAEHSGPNRPCSPPNLLEAALKYAKIGWYVIPLHHPTKDGKCSCGRKKCNCVGKHPRIPDWQNQASIDPEQMKKWWRQWPDANIGIVAGKSGLVVLDVDPDRGGLKSFHNVFNNTWPETPTSRTGGGGFHLAFQHPGVPVRNAVNIAPGLDIRADGGYFVAPPSLHESGHRYEWMEGKGPDNVVVVPLSEPLLQLIKSGGNRTEKRGTCLGSGVLAGLPEGMRDNEVFKYCCDFLRRNRNVKKEELDALAIEKGRNCDPPFPEEECLKCANSAWSYRKEEPQPEIFELKDLMERPLPEPKFIIPDILPEGVTIFAGKSKAGESMLLTDVSLSVALGSSNRPVLGKYQCDKVGVLFLPLEENERSFRARVYKQLAGNSLPDNFHVAFGWRRGELAVDYVDAFLEKHPGIQLVIIDTLQKVRPEAKGGKREYEIDYEAIDPWRYLAAKYQGAIILVHHIRKADDEDFVNKVSGTTGLTGSADTIMVMDRKRKNKYATIKITGRAIQETTLVVERNDETLTWTAQDPEEYLLSAERKEILDLLQQMAVELSPHEIAQMLNKKEGNVRRLLCLMVNDKQVLKPSRGRYCAELQLQPETWQDRERKSKDIKQRLRDL